MHEPSSHRDIYCASLELLVVVISNGLRGRSGAGSRGLEKTLLQLLVGNVESCAGKPSDEKLSWC